MSRTTSKNRITLLFATLLSALMLSAALPLGAVEIDSGGTGEVLILPLWTTTDSHSTLLHVQSRNAGMARLRVLDAAGDVVLSGNLYFKGVWTAGIGAANGGGSQLVSGGSSCLLLSGDDGVVPAERTTHISAESGSLEMIVMGRADHEVLALPENQSLRDAFYSADCEALAAEWNDGIWSDDPTFGLEIDDQYRTQLSANWSIVQVERGTLYNVPGIALDGYSDRLQHTPPGDTLPNLASGHDDGTDDGMTHSRVCNDGVCREDTWPTPLDAMAAALMASRYAGDYAIDPGLGAATDLVFNFPLAPYYAAREGEEHPLSTAYLGMYVYSRTYAARVPVICPGVIPPGESCSDANWRTIQSAPMLAVSFNPADTLIAPSGLLGLASAYRLELPEGSAETYDPMFPVGVFEAALTRSSEDNSPVAVLMSNDGTRYFGAPVLSVVFQQFVNGLLPAGDGVTQRANYGASFVPTKSTYSIPVAD